MGTKTLKAQSKSVLSNAVKDLTNKMQKLSREKADLHRALGKINSGIDVDRKLEKKLQERMAAIVEMEAALVEKKKVLQSKLDNISDTMSKISKIKSEMSDL